MDRMIYVAMSGARETMHRMATNNHNLANASTTGFKAVIDAFETVPVEGAGRDSRSYAIDRAAGADLSPGTIRHTGGALDVAIDDGGGAVADDGSGGAGFLVVQDPDGAERLTRDGALRVGATGLLETSAGHPVLGDGGPIGVSPYASIAIGGDGTVSIRPLGEGPEASVTLDRVRLVRASPDAIERDARGLFAPVDGAVPPDDASVRLQPESLEQSNVDTVGALVTMIELARRHEANVKLMSAAEDNDARAAKLLGS